MYDKLHKLSLILFVLLLASCSLKYKKAIQVASVVHDAWPIIQVAYANAYNKNKITDDQWNEFIDLDKKVLETQNSLVNTLKLYKAAKKMDLDSSQYIEQIDSQRELLLQYYTQAITNANNLGITINASVSQLGSSK